MHATSEMDSLSGGIVYGKWARPMGTHKIQKDARLILLACPPVALCLLACRLVPAPGPALAPACLPVPVPDQVICLALLSR